MPAEYIVKAVVLVLVGVIIGTIGTLVGLGGGFAVVPVLVLFTRLKDADRSVAAATSLVAVFLNACSGTFHYARQKRIDVAAGLLVAMAAIPSAVLGAATVEAIGGKHFIFDITFAVVAALMAALLIGGHLVAKLGPLFRRKSKRRPHLVFDRRMQLRDGSYLNYRLDARRGLLTGAICGFIAGFLGIGGGIVQVPFMILFMGLPVHIAVATSQFILLFSTASATIFNAGRGRIQFDLALPIGLGLIIGAAIGARISRAVGGWFIRMVLAFILLLIAVWMFFTAF